MKGADPPNYLVRTEVVSYSVQGVLTVGRIASVMLPAHVTEEISD